MFYYYKKKMAWVKILIYSSHVHSSQEKKNYIDKTVRTKETR